MNILFTRTTHRISGAENYNFNLLKQFKKDKKVKAFFITDFKPFADRLMNLNIPTTLVPLRIKEIGIKKELLIGIVMYPYILFQYIAAIRNIEKKAKINIVCMESMTEKIFLTPWMTIFNIKSIWLEHGPIYVTTRSKIVKIIYKHMSIFADAIIATSKDVEKDLLIGRISQKKIHTIVASIDTDHFSPLNKKMQKRIRTKLTIKLKSPVIGFSTTLSKEKGILEFIDTAKYVILKNNKTIFLVVGDGEYYEIARDMVKRLGIEENFRFIGFQKDVKLLIGIMDIYYFPTNHHEGISMTLLEAAAMKLIIFTHNIGGNREIILNGKTGFLYSRMSIKKRASYLLNMINHLDAYGEIRQQAREHVVNNYNIEKMAKNFYELFKTYEN